jgi:hypothetical protein
MTAAEHVRLKRYDDNTLPPIGCALAVAAFLVIGAGAFALLGAGVASLLGKDLDPSAVLPLVVAVALAGAGIVVLMLAHRWIVRPIAKWLDPRRDEYRLVDELHLRDPDVFTSYDPVGHEEGTHHGKIRVFEEEYLLVVAPQRILFFDDHARGDIPIFEQLTSDGRPEPFGAFPSECRMTFRARDGKLMAFTALGPLRDAIGCYHIARRPSAVAHWLTRRASGPLVLLGDMERPADLRRIGGGLEEAFGAADAGSGGMSTTA